MALCMSGRCARTEDTSPHLRCVLHSTSAPACLWQLGSPRSRQPPSSPAHARSGPPWRCACRGGAPALRTRLLTSAACSTAPARQLACGSSAHSGRASRRPRLHTLGLDHRGLCMSGRCARTENTSPHLRCVLHSTSAPACLWRCACTCRGGAPAIVGPSATLSTPSSLVAPTLEVRSVVPGCTTVWVHRRRLIRVGHDCLSSFHNTRAQRPQKTMIKAHSQSTSRNRKRL